MQFPRKAVTLVLTAAVAYLLIQLGVVDTDDDVDEALSAIVAAIITYFVPED